MMQGYHIELIGPDVVQIHEDVASYPMTKEQALENIEVVKAHCNQYASHEAYLRRLEFYEDVLKAFDKEHKS